MPLDWIWIEMLVGPALSQTCHKTRPFGLRTGFSEQGGREAEIGWGRVEEGHPHGRGKETIPWPWSPNPGHSRVFGLVPAKQKEQI